MPASEWFDGAAPLRQGEISKISENSDARTSAPELLVRGELAMPRGSKPGERRGGRRRGTPNKKTVLSNAAISAVAANPDLTPLDFLRGVMLDPNASPDMRLKAAQAAAPYIHAKPRRGAHPGDPADATLLGETGAFTIDTMVAKALGDDHERLNYLMRKEAAPRVYGGPLSAAEADEESRLRRSIAEKARAIGCPAGYGSREARHDGSRLHQLYCKRISPGGSLAGAEDIEEAHLVARVAAFDESPEGCARRRIFELILEDYGRGLSATQRNELHRLQTLYPDDPDPDDPLREAIEAMRKARAEG
jgi:hypothetical protein